MMTFAEFVEAATGGRPPYPYQSRLAAAGLPDVLRAPTGSGKTLAATLPWVYRRRLHPDPDVRAATPRWLVVVLPQRTLVEQTAGSVRSWLDNTQLDIPVHVLMGGEDRDDRVWRMDPAAERIFVGTQDMALSRLLMRGYAEPRGRWPGTFGLMHNDVQFVFDEVQLMGPGLPTSLQLQGLREAIGTFKPSRSMWMSATLDPRELRTIDFQRTPEVTGITDADRTGELGQRLDATRTIRRLAFEGDNPRKRAAALAAVVVAEHREGSRTLVVLNTVERATELAEAIQRAKPAAPVVLLHSRFRPADRQIATRRALEDPGVSGRIVVATQVLEAGVDITSTTLITETAPWSSIVQRAGRCNRDGRAEEARLFWLPPPTGKAAHLPYDVAELEHSEARLTELEGRPMTGEALAEYATEVGRPVHPVLRRRDLVALFDTTADLFGNDIDVGPFIRDADDRGVFVAWRRFPLTDDEPAVARAELCPAPLALVRGLADDGGRASRLDQRTGNWAPVRGRDLRPGVTVVLDAARGGYLPERGFAPESRTPVAPVDVERRVRPESLDTDPLSAQQAGQWISLTQHLADTEREARAVIADLGVELLPVEALIAAARVHDLGKAHPTFQASLEKANPDHPPPPTGGPWAKSPGRAPLRHDPPHFRHELVSALMLLREPQLLADFTDPELVVYLVAAHHGNVRVTVRGHPDERGGLLLGVRNGDRTIPFTVPGFGDLPELELTLDPVRLGAGSLTGGALRLRDQLGPFRLALLEAVVVAADWRASAGYVSPEVPE